MQYRLSSFVLPLAALSTLASATNSNSTNTDPVDFVRNDYPELIPIESHAKCPNLNFDWVNRGYYPKADAKITDAYQVDETDFEITLEFKADDCPPITNLDQAAIIGVNSPENSTYYLHDSNKNISNINSPCEWAATFIVKGEAVDGVFCVPEFQIHYAWFSGLASSRYAESWKYHTAYEYSMGCVSDNNNDAQDDFSQYCFDVEAVPEKPSSKSFTSKAASATTAATTASIAPFANLYAQCGGQNYVGPTECVTGAICASQNPFYYQCLSKTTSKPAVFPSATLNTITTSAIPSAIPSTITPSITSKMASSTSSSTTSSATLSTTAAPKLSLQALWGQCGGQNWNGPTACEAGAVCSSMNPFYFQCLAGPTPTTTSTSTTATTPGPVPTVFQNLYGQCGGINWNGATACAQGACSSMNPYYFQCIPTAY